MRSIHILLISLLCLSCAYAQTQTIRQRSTTEGLSIGLQGSSLGWSSDYFQFLDERTNGGGGLGGRIGFGLTQRLEVFGQYDHNSFNTDQIAAKSFQFSHLTGGFRFNFGATTRRLRPYAELGYSIQTGKLSEVVNQKLGLDDLLFMGGTGHLGAGLNYFISLPIALNIGGSIQAGGKHPIQLNGTDTGEKADITSFRLQAGIILYLSEL